MRASRGSSPLTRGKPPGDVSPARAERLIPAHAGKTLCCSGDAPGAGAHPRSRGENSGNRVPLAFDAGSSPLTRGKRVPGAEVGRRAGLIPAHAGKTVLFVRQPLSHRAHPRSRGENRSIRCIAFCGPGSSPLTRGKLCDLIPILRRQRLIPAHAGKTGKRVARSGGRTAHPRSRGENAPLTDVAEDVRGSSPLTRGKP